MDITTKELFELAEFYWKNGPELDDYSETERIDWEDLSPAWQAEEAESIRALLGELENRGWFRSTYPQRYLFGVNSSYTLSDLSNLYNGIRSPWAMWSAPEVEVNMPREPRKWDLIEDVPTDVKVKDRTGDTIFFHPDKDLWMVSGKYGDADWHDPDQNSYAPFTEIIEEKPAEPEPLAEWEKLLVNPDGPWDHWQDVPEDVKYTGQNMSIYGTSPTWVNRGGERMWLPRFGGEVPSNQSDIQETYAPFVKVEG